MPGDVEEGEHTFVAHPKGEHTFVAHPKGETTLVALHYWHANFQGKLLWCMKVQIVSKNIKYIFLWS